MTSDATNARAAVRTKRMAGPDHVQQTPEFTRPERYLQNGRDTEKEIVADLYDCAPRNSRKTLPRMTLKLQSASQFRQRNAFQAKLRPCASM
jgi:hypothetical protein